MCFTLVISSLSIGGLSTLFDAIGEPANSRVVGTRGGAAIPPDFADQLTLFQQGGQIKSTKLLTPSPFFQTFLRPCACQLPWVIQGSVSSELFARLRPPAQYIHILEATHLCQESS